MLTIILTIVLTLIVALVIGVAFYYIGVRVWTFKPKLTPMVVHMVNAADFSRSRKGWVTPIFRIEPKSEQQKPS